MFDVVAWYGIQWLVLRLSLLHCCCFLGTRWVWEWVWVLRLSAIMGGSTICIADPGGFVLLLGGVTNAVACHLS